MEVMQERGKKLIIESEFWDDQGQVPFALAVTRRETKFWITRNHVNYAIEIQQLANKKEICIESSDDVKLDMHYEIAMDVIRFENLFEGRFYSIKSCRFDDVELLPGIEKGFLGYMISDKVMAGFYITFDDKEYKKLFVAFKKYISKKILQYHVSLYATYLKGMTADLRMAQLLEVFEPLTIELSEEGKISLSSAPYRVVGNNCPKCGTRVTRRIRNTGLHLKDLLTAVIKSYGKDIFRGDSTAKIVKKSVVLRNRIDHVDNQHGALTGPECGHYLYKFSLLYRIIVMQEIGIPYDFIQGRVKVLVEDFNKHFPDQRILP